MPAPSPIKGENFFYAGLTAFLCILSLFIAFQLRMLEMTDVSGRERIYDIMWQSFFWMVPLKVVLLYSFGQLEIMAARFRQTDFYKLTIAIGMHAVFTLYLWYAFEGEDVPPRLVIMMDFFISLLAISALRVMIQRFRADAFGINDTAINTSRVVVIGAGFVGTHLVEELMHNRGLGMRPVAFLDDDPSRAGVSIHGISVEGDRRALKRVVDKYDATKVIIALPGARPDDIGDILGRAYELGLPVLTTPLPEEMVYGRIHASQLRQVEVDDLIARSDQVIETIDTYDMISGRVVLITGAGGSIGAEIVRQVAIRKPSRLLLLDQSEIQLFEVEQRLHLEGYGSTALSLIADIADSKRMQYIFDHYHPNVIFHAAAHKHVSLMESQPAEAIKNNVRGTQVLAGLATKFKVERFVMISTDKAINPSSAMGASKRLAELIIQQYSSKTGSHTKFISVRFGNVLNSSGSVVPIFKRQIAHGGPVTVTHPEATRYFMTIPESVSLVLQAAALGEGGEIFLLDMGKPIKILNLANQMIELAGYKPDVDIDIKIIGLRPGEKLFEQLHYDDEKFEETARDRILKVKNPVTVSADFEEKLYALINQADGMERNILKQEMRKLIPEYTPYLD